MNELLLPEPAQKGLIAGIEERKTGKKLLKAEGTLQKA